LEKVAFGAFSDISFVAAGKKRGFCRLRSVYFVSAANAFLRAASNSSPGFQVGIVSACDDPTRKQPELGVFDHAIEVPGPIQLVTGLVILMLFPIVVLLPAPTLRPIEPDALSTVP
jgi:hypothetical protein